MHKRHNMRNICRWTNGPSREIVVHVHSKLKDIEQMLMANHYLCSNMSLLQTSGLPGGISHVPLFFFFLVESSLELERMNIPLIRGLLWVDFFFFSSQKSYIYSRTKETSNEIWWIFVAKLGHLFLDSIKELAFVEKSHLKIE